MARVLALVGIPEKEPVSFFYDFAEQSYERAVEWFEKASSQGDAGAMVGLGPLHDQGLGVPQSYERAVELFKQSAAMGDAVSQRNQF